MEASASAAIAEDRAARAADGDVEEGDQRRPARERRDQRRSAGDDARPRPGASGGTTAPRRRPRRARRRRRSRARCGRPAVATRTSALSPRRDRVHREVDDPVARRAPAVGAVAQLARQQHALPARQRRRARRAAVGHGLDSVRTGPGADPRPKSTRAIDRAAVAAGGPRAPMLAAMIDSEGLTKRYGGRTVVEDVSFRCEPGTVTGFLGPNGAGKTTTLRMLVRPLASPTRAGATVLGGRYRDLPNPGAPRRRPARRLRPAPGPPRARGARGLRADDRRRPRARRRAARRSSASTARPRASACASTRWACASGSASRTRCSATRRS